MFSQRWICTVVFSRILRRPIECQRTLRRSISPSSSASKSKPSKKSTWKRLLTMEAICSSETLVDFYRTTRRYITGDSTLQTLTFVESLLPYTISPHPHTTGAITDNLVMKLVTGGRSMLTTTTILWNLETLQNWIKGCVIMNPLHRVKQSLVERLLRARKLDNIFPTATGLSFSDPRTRGKGRKVSRDP
jgi:hypothetical protein